MKKKRWSRAGAPIRAHLKKTPRNLMGDKQRSVWRRRPGRRSEGGQLPQLHMDDETRTRPSIARAEIGWTDPSRLRSTSPGAVARA